jgi:hypothetical protein
VNIYVYTKTAELHIFAPVLKEFKESLVNLLQVTKVCTKLQLDVSGFSPTKIYMLHLSNKENYPAQVLLCIGNILYEM